MFFFEPGALFDESSKVLPESVFRVCKGRREGTRHEVMLCFNLFNSVEIPICPY